MAESRLKTRLSPLPGAPNVEEQSQELWVSRGKGFGKGLNTQSSNSQQATTTVLAGVEGEDTAERRHRCYPGSGPSREVKPLRPACGVLHCLERFTVQEELVELEVSNSGYCLAR